MHGDRTLHRLRRTFYVWDSTCYREHPGEQLRTAVYDFLDEAVIKGTGGPKSSATPFNPNLRKVNDVIDALKAVCILQDDLEVPC